MTVKILGSFFGLGFLPLVPGTWGTLGAIPLFFLLQIFEVNIYLFIFIFSLISTVISHFAAQAAEEEDPSFVVVDEVAGMLLAVAGIKTDYIFTVVFLGFVLFRIFDIIKPFPAYQSQKIPYGIGIMADDLIAGFYANIIIRTLILWGVLDKLHSWWPALIK